MDVREKLVDILDHIYLPMMDGPNTIGEYRIPNELNEEIADHLITNGVTMQEWISVEDRLPRNYTPLCQERWEWFEEWNPSTSDHPTECEDCGWRCSRCKTALEDVVGGYWDNPDEVPKVKFCPNCGVRIV